MFRFFSGNKAHLFLLHVLLNDFFFDSEHVLQRKGNDVSPRFWLAAAVLPTKIRIVDSTYECRLPNRTYLEGFIRGTQCT